MSQIVTSRSGILRLSYVRQPLYFGDGTLVGGNDNKCFEYTLNAITEEEMDEALIIVAMNSDNYAGTCYMYYPESATGTYGSGPSVAYFPKGGEEILFRSEIDYIRGFNTLALSVAETGSLC